MIRVNYHFEATEQAHIKGIIIDWYRSKTTTWSAVGITVHPKYFWCCPLFSLLVWIIRGSHNSEFTLVDKDPQSFMSTSLQRLEKIHQDSIQKGTSIRGALIGPLEVHNPPSFVKGISPHGIRSTAFEFAISQGIQEIVADVRSGSSATRHALYYFRGTEKTDDEISRILSGKLCICVFPN